MRLLQPGDSASYTMFGTFTPPGQTANTVTGSTVHRVVSRNGDVLTVVHDLHIIINGAPFDVHQQAVERQNPDGSIVPISDNGGTNGATRTVTANTFVSPGTYSVPLFVSGSTSFSDGSTSQSTLNVYGTGTANSAVGVFATYLAKGSTVSSYGTRNDTVDAISPGLGFFITRTETGTGSTGVIQVTYTLSSTTVSLPEH